MNIQLVNGLNYALYVFMSLNKNVVFFDMHVMRTSSHFSIISFSIDIIKIRHFYGKKLYFHFNL